MPSLLSRLQDVCGTSAIAASVAGDRRAVRAALAAGPKEEHHHPKTKCTPLHRAIDCGRDDIVRELLELHADPNAADLLSRTPLHIAVIRRDADAVEALLSAKADPTLVDDRGRTPLQLLESSSAFSLKKFHHAVENKITRLLEHASTPAPAQSQDSGQDQDTKQSDKPATGPTNQGAGKAPFLSPKQGSRVGAVHAPPASLRSPLRSGREVIRSRATSPAGEKQSFLREADAKPSPAHGTIDAVSQLFGVLSPPDRSPVASSPAVSVSRPAESGQAEAKEDAVEDENPDESAAPPTAGAPRTLARGESGVKGGGTRIEVAASPRMESHGNSFGAIDFSDLADRLTSLAATNEVDTDEAGVDKSVTDSPPPPSGPPSPTEDLSEKRPDTAPEPAPAALSPRSGWAEGPVQTQDGAHKSAVDDSADAGPSPPSPGSSDESNGGDVNPKAVTITRGHDATGQWVVTPTPGEGIGFSAKHGIRTHGVSLDSLSASLGAGDGSRKASVDAASPMRRALLRPQEADSRPSTSHLAGVSR